MSFGLASPNRLLVFLKCLKESYLPIDQTEWIQPLPGEKVYLRQDDMDVDLPLNRVSASSIGVTLTRNVGFGIEGIFVSPKSGRRKRFEGANNLLQHLARYFILF